MDALTSKPTPADTRQRLLEAAARTFARCGLEGATTREIAREAGVNEVTLFRHFQSKDNLLAAVLHRTFDRPETAETGAASEATTPDDFRANLRRYMRQYETLLRTNIPLVRTLIGEIHRHTEHEVRVLKGIFAPIKVELIAALHAARERGFIRADANPLIAADLLWSMVFMEVLRRTSSICPDYPPEQYFEVALDLFLRGITPGSVRSKRAPRHAA